jgi:hypothetical protein
MGSFIGGSAFAMARGIADGYHIVTERSFKVMPTPDLLQLGQELDNHLREVRGEQPPLEDLQAIKARARKIQRLNTALMILRNYQMKSKR